MRTIILHHVETCWEASLRRIGGLSFDSFASKIAAHIRRAKYDRVILTRFEEDSLEDAHYESGLDKYISEVEEYAYGWSADMFDNPADYVEGGSHSEVVWVPQWIKELPKKEVYLCGAFDGECIEDMEIALSSCGIKFKRVESLIV